MHHVTRGLTIVELLAAGAAGMILVSVAVPVVAQTGRIGATRLDAKQIIDIHAGFLMFAAHGDGTLPTPGLIDTVGPEPGGPPDHSQDHSAAVYSSAVAQLYVTTEELIGPTEVNDVVVHDDDYDFEAYDPANDVYWDPSFQVEIYGVPGTHECNTSYAHMAVCGDRRDLKCATRSSPMTRFWARAACATAPRQASLTTTARRRSSCTDRRTRGWAT